MMFGLNLLKLGSKLGPADKLRQVKIAAQWKLADHRFRLELGSCWQGWWVGQPLAKMAVMNSKLHAPMSASPSCMTI